MLAEYHLLDQLQLHAYTPNGEPLCIYGDPAYPLRVHLQTPYQGNRLTNLQKQYNTAMSNVRVSVEWLFKEILTYFAFVDFQKKSENRLECDWKNVCSMHLTNKWMNMPLQVSDCKLFWCWHYVRKIFQLSLSTRKKMCYVFYIQLCFLSAVKVLCE